MIISDTTPLSPIILTILLIIYLIIIELGNKRTKIALSPFTIVLGIIFFIIAITSIYSTYMGIK